MTIKKSFKQIKKVSFWKMDNQNILKVGVLDSKLNKLLLIDYKQTLTL